MKSEVAPAVAPIHLEVEETTLMGDFMALTKARLTLLVLITTFVGFCLASPGALDWPLLFHTLAGTALVAASAAMLNQAIEIKVDRLMERTRSRPLPAGRMKRDAVTWAGIAMGATGLAYLALAANWPSAVLAGATLVIYLAVYTPLKRRHPLCVTVGAISGAIPPVIGWTAAGESATAAGAWVLFGVLFLWQMPHFLAIAWMYRDEYAQAGFHMLNARDLTGESTAWKALLYSLALAAVTLVPFFLGWAGFLYAAIALVINFLLLYFAVLFVTNRSRQSARRLFFSSIIYLPVILGLMVFARF